MAAAERPFSHAALTWLRDHQHLRTVEMPTDHVQDVDGRVRIDAYVPRGNIAGHLGFAVLCACMLGMVLVMAKPPGMSPETVATLYHVGIAANVLAAVLAVAALVVHRLRREHYLVELRLHADPVQPDAIDRLRADAAGRHAWMLVRGGLSADTVARARRDGVRCFELSNQHWVERL